MVTTDGRTAEATASTEPSVAGVSPWSTTGVVAVAVADEEVASPWVWSHSAAPPKPAPPPTSRVVAEDARHEPARGRRRGAGGGACWGAVP